MTLPDLLTPLRAAVELLLATFHTALFGADPAGLTWLAALAVLVVAVRTAMLPIAVRQARSAARMRALAPEAARIRDRYRRRTDTDARQALARETAALYAEHGISPMSSLLPALIQIPVFLALVQAIEQAAHAGAGVALASFAAAAVLGAPLAATALGGGIPGAAVGGVLLLVTAAAQVTTQLIAAGGGSAPGGRLLLLLPLLTAASGLLFPIGVTAYWACSAVWTLGQQAVLQRALRPRGA